MAPGQAARDKLTRNSTRRLLWSNAIDLTQCTADLPALKKLAGEKISDENFLIDGQKFRTIAEQINLDVARSYTGDAKSLISHDQLNLLLQAYALYQPEINYCQGINFLMGFLHIVLQDEDLAFKMFSAIMSEMLKDMMSQDFYRLKILFYQFNRLLQINLPALEEHMKKIKIEATHFASSWFLTLFTT